MRFTANSITLARGPANINGSISAYFAALPLWLYLLMHKDRSSKVSLMPKTQNHKIITFTNNQWRVNEYTKTFQSKTTKQPVVHWANYRPTPSQNHSATSKFKLVTNFEIALEVGLPHMEMYGARFKHLLPIKRVAIRACHFIGSRG